MTTPEVLSILMAALEGFALAFWVLVGCRVVGVVMDRVLKS